MDKKELLQALQELLEEEDKGGGEGGRTDYIRDMYIPKVPSNFYDPGYARLRKLIWPGR